jgi:parallel beta-helix repeat protein
MKLSSFLLSVLVVLPPAIGLQARSFTLYVAPNGSDQWSGGRAAPEAAGKDGPLATLPAALHAARLARQQPAAVQDGITILLRGGAYQLAEPVMLRPQDSGASPQQPLTIAAFPGERPVLSGGRRITGWTQVAGQPGLWQTEVPAVREGRWYFRQLFIDGQRKVRARTPNQGYFRIQGESPQDKPVKLKFKPGDIKKEWADDGDVEVVGFLAWGDLRMQIRAVDEAAHVATLSGEPRPSNKEANAQYFVENAPDALDQPGEWYLERKSGRLTYWAQAGEDLRRAEVIAPMLGDLLIMDGDFDAKQPVRHMVLRGLTFAYTDYTLGEQGYADTQAAILVRGNVRAEGAQDCLIEDCLFTHLAGYALELGRGCRRIQVIGNEMADLGAGGVRLGEAAIRADPFEQSHGQVVTDNHIHHGGVIYAPAVGVFILQSGGNRVAHNHIHHLYYTAISVGWNWGYRETPCRDNIIEYNHLHDLGQFLLSDMGAVYTLGIQKGTVIRNNLIHDVNAFTYGGWGLYTDEGSSEIVLENNVVFRCKSAGFHQHYGRDNLLRNNIFAFNRENQLMRSRDEPHLSFCFTNNIVYFDSGQLLGSTWANDNYAMEANVYFDTRAAGLADPKMFAGLTLAAWRQRKHDLHSVIADPLFVDPTNLNFRLKPESPALKLGFKPIDLSQVGIRPKARRSAH